MSELMALQKAIEAAQGQTALADLIGTKQGNIWYWLKKKGRVPADYVLKVEQATGGKVTRHELRPDIYPIEDSAA